MNTNELFVESNKLPKSLSKEEVYELFKKFYAGEYSIREKIIMHNIKLVIYEVINKYNYVCYDKKDLVSIGIIGLTKAVDTFDISKNYEFSTYAARCIDNEILLFLRYMKVRSNVVSFSEIVRIDNNGKMIELKDTISDSINLSDEYIEKEESDEVRTLVEKLPEREREIIKLYFGFYGKKYTQIEIANKFNMPQSNISKIVKRVLAKLRVQLEDNELTILDENKKKLVKSN